MTVYLSVSWLDGEAKGWALQSTGVKVRQDDTSSAEVLQPTGWGCYKDLCLVRSSRVEKSVDWRINLLVDPDRGEITNDEVCRAIGCGCWRFVSNWKWEERCDADVMQPRCSCNAYDRARARIMMGLLRVRLRLVESGEGEGAKNKLRMGWAAVLAL